MTASKYRVELSESQKRRLSEVAHRGKSPARAVKRALALLKADEGQIDNRIADALSISRRTVVRIRKRFCEEGALYRNGTLHNNRHFCTKIKPPSVKCRQGLAD